MNKLSDDYVKRVNEWHEPDPLTADLIAEREKYKAQRDELLSALQEARPVVLNAIHEGTQDWRKETRQMILANVDAAIRKVEADKT